ncbi:MAG: hypothetical protein CMM07_27355 [Rhodopirellula sp.]|nr:hypothetical protein [Rhodopirellula sp.]
MKYALTLAAVFAVLPSLCSAEDMGAFGLGDVEVITEAEGQNVRGLGMFARTTSAAGISMNILDPNTGSQWNVFNTAFDSSDDTKLTSDVTAAPTGLGVGVQSSALAAISELDVTIGNDVDGVTNSFSFTVGGFGSNANGQALGGSDLPFTFQPITFSAP